ncbi:MAG: HPF/RaiA family ribosome-associated protein [bacterium]|nr:HPF/RaiA family ribosome-associated protein [bacterium]
MRLNLKATNITLTSDIREYLEKRLQSLDKLVSFDDPAVMVDVELGRTTRHHQNGDIFFAEINIHKGKETFRSVSDRPDILSAIDDMRDEIAGELSARKGKLISLSRRGGQFAKAFLKGSYNSMGYFGRPARAGWKYMRRLWRRKETIDR